MAVKDHKQHFEGLRQAPTVADKQVPNSVSRAPGTGDRAFSTVAAEAGRPVLDADINLRQEALWMQSFLQQRWHHPSGWMLGQGHRQTQDDFILGTAIPGVSDNTPGGGHIFADGTLIDSVLLKKLEASVAGYQVVVEYSNTAATGYNLIPFQAPTIYDGNPGGDTVKRTDFVFLEVWRALVAPSPKARGELVVVSAADIDLVGPDQIIINGNALSAVAGAPGLDEFTVDAGSETNTAINIATAINDPANSFSGDVTATAFNGNVTIKALEPGVGGNAITLSLVVSVLGCLTVSGAALSGGEDRPNKPATKQGQVFRHGNTESPAATWLDDEINDSVYDMEASQRVQVQYRIRVTGQREGVNFKQHPDGFSTNAAGVPTIYAQGGRDAPVYTGNPAGDTNSYPFVPANNSNVWLQSSAAAYGFQDDGLWVAGSGNERSAQDLGAVDGFVFSIPIGFFFRHNNASDPLAALPGFYALENTNGAPTYNHIGFASPVWPAPAGDIPPGVSDRPDGEFCDVIRQFLDLRRHVSPSGIDLQGELQFQMQTLLDNRNRTWAVDTASKQVMGASSGDVSPEYLVCNEIGRPIPDGAPPMSGDTDRGVRIRNFDHVARRFADQSVIERLTVGFWPGDRQGAGNVDPGTINAGRYVTKFGAPLVTDQWCEDDVLHLDLTRLDVTTLGGLFDARGPIDPPGPGVGDGGGSSGAGLASTVFSHFAPPGTIITDVLSAWHDDGHYDFADATHPQEVQIKRVIGLGTQHVEITLDANDSLVTGGNPIVLPADEYQMVYRVGAPLDGSKRRVFIEFEVTYPAGQGTTDLPLEILTPSATVYDGTTSLAGPGPLVENDLANRPTDCQAKLAPRFREGYREIQQEYLANDAASHGIPAAGVPIGGILPEDLVSRSRTQVVFPRRVYDDTWLQVVDPVIGVAQALDPAASAFGSSARTVELAAPLSGMGRSRVAFVWYFAQDAIPNYGSIGDGWQLGIYYRAVAPQTAGVMEGDITTAGSGVLPSVLSLRPLLMPGNLWTGHAGSGSPDLAFPYTRPLEQIPICDGSVYNPVTGVAGTTEEWYFSGLSYASVADFNADTGMLNLHAFVQQDIQDNLDFGGLPNTKKPRKDADFRAFYPFADDSVYRPVVMAQASSGAVRHKVLAPFLATVTTEVPGANQGLLFRRNELVLVVLSRFAEFDAENNVWFLDTANRTVAAVYRTKNLLLVVGD